MEILGVGLPEMAFIVLIALILLGPKDMIAAGRTIGGTLRKFLTSPAWLAMRRTGEELQQLPTKLVREAGLEELQSEIQNIKNPLQSLDVRKAFDERQVFAPVTGTPATPTTASIAAPPPVEPPTGMTESPSTNLKNSEA
ncbi:MAG: twin-arginine translocase TatA/TatE family subunit [Chloroflexi bacterium]|nr:twin-arginine translocase TatA/TatE family subunit [Chloroflexota bacterium]